MENWINILNKLDKKPQTEEYTICSCNQGSLILNGGSDFHFKGDCSLNKVCAVVQLDRYQSSVSLSIENVIFKPQTKEIEEKENNYI